jgi:hypothetical protein
VRHSTEGERAESTVPASYEPPAIEEREPLVGITATGAG